jgi:hypothetical protein
MSDVPTRLLRETLRARLAVDPAAECLDSETATPGLATARPGARHRDGGRRPHVYD